MAPPVAEKQRGYASKVSCRKRMESLKKKARELSVLCGTDTCLLILGPDGKNESWPGNWSDVMSIICRAKSCDGKKKALSSPNSRFTLRSVGSSASIDSDDSWLDGLSPESLCNFRESLVEKMKAAKNRAESLTVVNEQEIWEVCAEIISLDNEQSSESAQTISGGGCFNAINIGGCAEVISLDDEESSESDQIVSGGSCFSAINNGGCAEIISLDDEESSESAQTISGGSCFNAINDGGCAEIVQPLTNFWLSSDCAASSFQHFQPPSPACWYQVAAEEQVTGIAESFVRPNNSGFDQSWPSSLFDF